MRFIIAVLAACALWAPDARAEVAASRPGAFLITAEAETTATPAQAWRALTQIGRWWNSTHTFSGDSRRLTLDARAGGCWCERWGGGSVEHMRVVASYEDEGVRTLRLEGGLGPLQELGVSGVLTFTLRPRASGATIAMTYRVAGEPHLNLESIAPLVDGVLMEQFGRLVRFSSGASPN